MSEAERKALVLSGLSHRYQDYKIVKSMHPAKIYDVHIQTGFSIYFIQKCRKICGKNQTNKDHDSRI